ncbi:MAG: hypothetical protein R3195_08520 [Gemmatimonadota bacterium]|nr:hypothetical protein [Gemmatimonadota bacterium]
MRKREVWLVCAALALGACEPGPESGGDTPFSPSFDHKGRPHGGGNGGSGGGNGGATTYDFTITGGVLASVAGLTPSRDNNKTIIIDFPSGAWNMTNTQAAADLERVDAAAGDACEFRPADMDDAMKQILVTTLGADRVNGELGVNKPEATGWIRFRNQPDQVWSSWGFNTQTEESGKARVDDNGSGVDWNDGASTRQFRYSGGIIRVLNAGDPTPGDGVELLCDVLDELLIVLAPE